MWQDPIVEEVRKQGELYTQQFDFKIDLIIQDLRKRQKLAGRKSVSFEPKEKVTPPMQQEK